MYTTPVYYYCSDVCLSTLTTRLFFSRATQVRSLPLSPSVTHVFSFCSVCISRCASEERSAGATATVVYSERTRTEAPSGGVERWRLPGWFPPRTAIRPSYTSAAIRAAPSPRRPSSLLSPRSRALPPPPLLSRVSSMPGAVRVIARATRDVASRRVGAIFAIPVRENRGRIPRWASPVDGWLWRISRQGEVIDFLSPSSVTRAHAH